MKLRVKNEYINKVTWFKSRLGTEIAFDGRNYYTQEKLAKLKSSEYFDKFIEEDVPSTYETTNTINVDGVIVHYVNTIKNTNPNDELTEELTGTTEEESTALTEDEYNLLTVKELLMCFGEIKHKGKKDLIKIIMETKDSLVINKELLKSILKSHNIDLNI